MLDQNFIVQLNLDESNYQGGARICSTHRGFDLSRFTSMEVEFCFQMPPQHNGPGGGHLIRI